MIPVVLWVVLAIAAGSCRGDLASGRSNYPRLVVLAFEGMPRETMEPLATAGALPGLAQLLARGRLHDLSGAPAVSDLPVAWTTIATGLSPGEHGIFGWLAPRDAVGPAGRNARLEVPASSADAAGTGLETLRIEPGASRLGGLLRRPIRVTRLARGEPFWLELAHQGRSAALLGMPFSFPPSGGPTLRLLSGPLAPGFGEAPAPFTILTSDPRLVEGNVPGGRIVKLGWAAGEGRAALPSPRVSAGPGALIPVQVIREDDGAVRVLLGGAVCRLQVGGWSEPVEITAQAPFDQIPTFRVRLHLERSNPNLVLYIGPATPPPGEREIPLSLPPGFAADLESRFGALHPDDLEAATAAVSLGLLAPTAAGEMAIEEVARLRRMVLQQIDLRRAELVVAVFTEVGSLLRAAALAGASSGAQLAVERVHRALDEVVEDVAGRLGESARLVVLSTRGAAPLDRRLNLAGWLATVLPAGVSAEVPSGGQVWLRGQGASPGHVAGSSRLSAEQVDAVVRAIMAGAPTARDPATGDPWLAGVERPRQPAGAVGRPTDQGHPDLLLRLRMAAGPRRLGSSDAECPGFVCAQPPWLGLAAGGLDAEFDRGWILTSWPAGATDGFRREDLGKRILDWLATDAGTPAPVTPPSSPGGAGHE